ncbi:hemophore-related protein [Mycobacterium sp. CVI_P3]|uniref:Hemophore-related protein n=1 Tax=Mycobacterium pinniadriaticum TaxID=2994102 RepID=A0ABT3S8K7_9MYCO|nr:hemophore-related protein [Mycobacterium pinniadriaticum]MCX2928858.1 hemophore-related protein [Mycobacterium pinniadriaticum]MCX2935275.1 hemophore-related protein [Mycobacterium pinniadriaticum]
MSVRRTTVAAGIAGLGFLLMATGVASAQPDLSPLVNTTCSYQQVVSALGAQAPDLAAELSKYPPAQAKLQRFLAAPVNTRQQMISQALAANPQWQNTIDEKAGTPQGQQGQSTLLAVAGTCNSY